MATTYTSTLLETTKIVSGTTIDGTNSSTEFDIDYTLIFEAMLAKLTSIDTHIASIDERILSIEELANGAKTPAGNGDTGIAVRHTSSEMGGFRRAMIVNSLRGSQQLENVVEEYQNPSEVPGL